MAKSTAAAPAEVPAEVVVREAAPSDEVARQNMLGIMREKFANEARVPVKLRNDGDVFVSINGYSFLIKPNVKVMVPESLVQHLEDAGYL